MPLFRFSWTSSVNRLTSASQEMTDDWERILIVLIAFYETGVLVLVVVGRCCWSSSKFRLQIHANTFNHVESCARNGQSLPLRTLVNGDANVGVAARPIKVTYIKSRCHLSSSSPSPSPFRDFDFSHHHYVWTPHVPTAETSCASCNLTSSVSARLQALSYPHNHKEVTEILISLLSAWCWRCSVHNVLRRLHRDSTSTCAHDSL
jgi:hypothetical protein